MNLYFFGGVKYKSIATIQDNTSLTIQDEIRPETQAQNLNLIKVLNDYLRIKLIRYIFFQLLLILEYISYFQRKMKIQCLYNLSISGNL